MFRLVFPLLPALVGVGCSDAFVTKDGFLPDDSGATTPTDTAPTDTEPDEEPTLAFVSPGEEAASPVTLSVVTTGAITRVGYYLESLPLVESTDASSGFSAVWLPDELGQLSLTARGYDADGVEVATDSTRTRVVDLGAENALGVWLEDNEAAGYTHDELAQRLAGLGVKRVYIQTAGVGSGCEAYPDGCDETVPAAYHARGIEVFAFAVPSPNGGNTMPTNVTYVADADYDGYVVHLDDEWAGEGSLLDSTIASFRNKVDENITVGRAPSTFPLYLSAGPAPATLGLRLEVVDPYVDAFLPRLLVEEMGSEAVADPDLALTTAVCEYTSLGLTHPIHPVIGTLTGDVTPLGVNRFFGAGGAGSSVWRVPDAGDPAGVWDTWGKVDWTAASLPESATCG